MGKSKMSDPVSALGGKTYAGFAKIREIGPLGMISLRCDLAEKALPALIKTITSTKLPAPRRIETKDAKAAGWMSPDELLLILPYQDVAEAIVNIGKKLSGIHHLAVDVSDARAVFQISGPQAKDVLMKLAPVDFSQLSVGELRRTRVAQVAAAFWKDADGFTLVSFRSVAGYVMGLLEHSAQPGSDLYLH
jgi:sarcosine oxidase, subunit gamma